MSKTALAALTYANQLDGRIELNEARAEVWTTALANYPGDQIRAVIRDYYATTHTDQPISPPMIRRLISVKRDQAESKQTSLDRARERAAIERDGGRLQREIASRFDDPEFQATALQAAISRAKDLERKNQLTSTQQAKLDNYHETGYYAIKLGNRTITTESNQ